MKFANIVHGNIASSCDQPLRIDDKNIGFLIKPLLEHCCFKQSRNRMAWCLTFFKDSAFESSITIFFNESGEGLHDPKACWIDASEQREHRSHEAKVSYFLRGSGTKSIEDTTYVRGQTRLLVDRENMVLLCPHHQQFERIILCQALVLAYKDVLTTCMFELTRCIKSGNETQLITLYEDVLRFNAADYFSHPVDQQRSHELYDIWEGLSRHCRLNELRQELTQQLTDVANLIKEQRSQNEQREHQRWQEELQKKESAFNRRAMFISVAVTLLSLLTLVQLTPDTFSNFWASWASLISH